ncbi:MFS transporter [Hyphomicrobium nitrativorans NL23]|uniref:MFS transporter n=1 Tax=Hyphomicrobium nitrativorans NL23 TaxID=1029756 RepID=V5SA13_9HYPH|nr:OFA family MFS transporter [Hyphomicrobium nitrativorans]AHB47581.1 MFS transporter [Hyphomicrobium nitrativorans NL23]
MASTSDAANGSHSAPGLLDREAIVAKPGFNRWMVPPAALCIHLCIGMAYGFSVFWKPLQGALLDANGNVIPECSAGAVTFGEKAVGTLRALTATDCNWSQFDLGWMYTFFFVLLGVSAAIWGGWLERAGPRKAGLVSTLCWCGGLLIAAFGVYTHQLWLMWLGSGVIGGIGLGLGYISPVSTLIKWFPDRRGMATGMAIMGFGGGAMIGSPLATFLMDNVFKTATDPGVWQTFVAMAVIYTVFMIIGSFGYRLPPPGWKPEGWAPPVNAKSMITNNHVHLKDAHKTAAFWLIWTALCLNVSAGIGIIGAASPMLQETFGGALAGAPELGYAEMKDNAAIAATAAAVGAGFVGLISLFNIFGRFVWASSSDYLGRKSTYFIFFTLGAALYVLAAFAADWKVMALFVLCFCIIASMYGGGFSTVPAYLADIFGTQFVGAIHGRLLTAWSTAGIVGPVIVNYLHDTRYAEGIPPDQLYGQIFYILAGMLVVGFIANMLIRPVDPKWHMSEAEVAAEQAKLKSAAGDNGGSYGIGKGGLDAKAAAFWTLVGVPLAWGVWQTLEKALVLFW